MSTLPKGYLLSIKNGEVHAEKLFVKANLYHPDTVRYVVLSESPCKENNFKSATVLARYIGGEYYGVVTGDLLPVIKDHTVWTESSVAEAPFRVANAKTLILHGDACGLFTHQELSKAIENVNSLNMETFGNPCYTVVNEYGIPVDSNGHLYF